MLGPAGEGAHQCLCMHAGSGMAGFGVPSPMLQSRDGAPGGQRSSASPLRGGTAAPNTQYRRAGNTEERDAEDNSLSWMAPDFELDDLL